MTDELLRGTDSNVQVVAESESRQRCDDDVTSFGKTKENAMKPAAAAVAIKSRRRFISSDSSLTIILSKNSFAKFL